MTNKTYEYKVEQKTFNVQIGEMQAWLTSMGMSGWNLISCNISEPAIQIHSGQFDQISITASVNGTFVFKREQDYD